MQARVGRARYRVSPLPTAGALGFPLPAARDVVPLLAQLVRPVPDRADRLTVLLGECFERASGGEVRAELLTAWPLALTTRGFPRRLRGRSGSGRLRGAPTGRLRRPASCWPRVRR